MKHWVFDLDGTLVDSLTVHFQITGQIFQHFGALFTKAEQNELLKITATTFPQYISDKLGSQAVKPALQMFKQLNSEAFKKITPFPGILESLTALQQQGNKLAVWTARDLEATKIILDHTGLDTYFSICVSGTCVQQGKPHPEGLQRIADHFQCQADSMVMIGDFDSDMLGAQAFGTKAIRVLWHPDVEPKRCEIAHWQFHDVTEFKNWITKKGFTPES